MINERPYEPQFILALTKCYNGHAAIKTIRNDVNYTALISSLLLSQIIQGTEQKE